MLSSTCGKNILKIFAIRPKVSGQGAVTTTRYGKLRISFGVGPQVLQINVVKLVVHRMKIFFKYFYD